MSSDEVQDRLVRTGVMNLNNMAADAQLGDEEVSLLLIQFVQELLDFGNKFRCVSSQTPANPVI